MAERTGGVFARDRATLLLYASLGWFAYLQAAPGAVAPYLRDELDLSYGVASLHLTAFAAGSLLTGLAGPAVTRGWPRRTALATGLGGMGLGAVALALGGAAPLTIAAAFVMGALGTLVLAVVQAALADHHGDRRSTALTEANATASVGGMLAPLVVGGAAAIGLGWRAGLLAVLVLLPALALAGRATPLPEPVLAAAAGSGRARHGPAYPLALLLVFCGVGVEWTVGFWGAVFLRDEVGLATSTAVALLSVYYAAMLVGRMAGSVLTRRMSSTVLLGGSLATCALGFAFYWPAESPWVAVPGLAVIGLGAGLLFPMALDLAITAAAGSSTAASGHAVAAGASAVLLGPLVAGGLADAVGVRRGLIVVLVLLVTATGCLAAYEAAQRRTR